MSNTSLLNSPGVAPGPLSLNEVSTPAQTRSSLLNDLRIPTSQELFSQSTISENSGLNRLSKTERETINTTINEIRNSTSLDQAQKKELITQLVQDLTNPECINQGMNATCVPTSVQFRLLAIERPLQYVQMIRDLALNGKCTFNDPERSTVTLNDSAWKPEFGATYPYENRSITERIMQNVLMKYAIGQTDQAGGRAPLTYNQSNDLIKGTYQNQKVEYQGLFNDQIARLHQGITGHKCAALYTDEGRSTAIHSIEQSLSNPQGSKGVLVQLAWADSGVHMFHALVVQNIDRQRGIVELYNPHGASSTPPPTPGAIQRLSIRDFESRLECAFVETGRTNDGKISIRVPEYTHIVQEIRNNGGVVEEGKPLILHVSPPTASENEIKGVRTQQNLGSQLEVIRPVAQITEKSQRRSEQARAPYTDPKGQIRLPRASSILGDDEKLA